MPLACRLPLGSSIRPGTLVHKPVWAAVRPVPVAEAVLCLALVVVPVVVPDIVLMSVRLMVVTLQAGQRQTPYVIG